MTDSMQTDDQAAPNPFDPDKFRVTGAVDGVAAERVPTRLQVRKPSKQEFFRVNTDPAMGLVCGILDLKDAGEIYLVTPDAMPELPGDVRHVELRLCQNRQGVSFLWPVPMPQPDGRSNAWHETARHAATLGGAQWTRMVANMSEGAYQLYKAFGPIPEPDWPQLTLGDALKLAFGKGRVIDAVDHPVIQQLRGF